MKIHEYQQMMKYLTRPKDKLSKEEKKEVVLPTSTRSIKRKNRKYERTVCDHWTPLSDKPLVCRTVVSSN